MTTLSTLARVLPVGHLVQYPTPGAEQHVLRVPPVLGDQVAWKEVDVPTAAHAPENLHPQEVLDVRRGGAAQRAGGAIQGSDIRLERLNQSRGCSPIGHKVEVLDLLPDDPPRHRVDVPTSDVAPEPVGFDERCPPTHERIGHALARKRVRPEEQLSDGCLAELGEKKAPEERTGPPGEPLVHGDDRTVILLYLLFAQGECGDEGHVEVSLDAHVVASGTILDGYPGQRYRAQRSTVPASLSLVAGAPS